MLLLAADHLVQEGSELLPIIEVLLETGLDRLFAMPGHSVQPVVRLLDHLVGRNFLQDLEGLVVIAAGAGQLTHVLQGLNAHVGSAQRPHPIVLCPLVLEGIQHLHNDGVVLRLGNDVVIRQLTLALATSSQT